MSHPTSPATIASRQERAASRILDDERLRGDLADDEYQPLLDWALIQTDRIVAATGRLSDAEADSRIEEGLQAIREIVEAAGVALVAHAEGDARRRSTELAFIGNRLKRGEILQALARRLDAKPDLSGPDVATLIVEALGAMPAERSDSSQQESAP